MHTYLGPTESLRCLGKMIVPGLSCMKILLIDDAIILTFMAL